MSAPDYPTGAPDVRAYLHRQSARILKIPKDYLRTVKGIDDNVGRLTWLDENGLAEDTIVVYTSDQGMFLGELITTSTSAGYTKRRCVCCLCAGRAKSRQAAGRSAFVKYRLSAVAVDCAGIAAPAAMQGRSFRSLRGQCSRTAKRICLLPMYGCTAHLDTPAHMGVRTRRYKLAFFYGRTDASDAVELNTLYLSHRQR